MKNTISVDIQQVGKYFHLLVYKNGEVLVHHIAHGNDQCEKLKNQLESKIQRGDFNNYKTHREKIALYIQNEQLTSLMNRTKWEELRQAMYNLEIPPTYYIKYLFSNENEADVERFINENISYGSGDWNREHFYYIEIEWIKIEKLRQEGQGKLINSKIIDNTEQIRQILKQFNIPHEENERFFTIYGYKRTQKPN